MTNFRSPAGSAPPGDRSVPGALFRPNSPACTRMRAIPLRSCTIRVGNPVFGSVVAFAAAPQPAGMPSVEEAFVVIRILGEPEVAPLLASCGIGVQPDCPAKRIGTKEPK